MHPQLSRTGEEGRKKAIGEILHTEYAEIERVNVGRRNEKVLTRPQFELSFQRWF